MESAFGGYEGYARLVKIYGDNLDKGKRNSPSECVGTKKRTIEGRQKKDISKSYVKRSNLTMRMGMRSYTRLTNDFSKKLENRAHMCALFFLHYNFVRIHQTLRVTHAMAAGVTDKLHETEWIVDLIDARAP